MVRGMDFWLFMADILVSNSYQNRHVSVYGNVIADIRWSCKVLVDVTNTYDQDI